ncbi:putative monocarboxylate transporter [Ixodes scapularis]
MTTPRQPLAKEAQNGSSDGLDRCWHIPVIAALAMLAASIGRQNSGFFYVGFMEVFSINRSDASWPNSVTSVLINLSPALVTQVSSVCLPNYFDRQHIYLDWHCCVSFCSQYAMDNRHIGRYLRYRCGNRHVISRLH